MGSRKVVPDHVLIEAYTRLRSTHKVAAEVGMNFASVAHRLNLLGVELQKRRPKGDRKGIPLAQPEKEFMASVVEMAQWLGWLTYHTWVSLHSAAGFPDLVLVHPEQRRVIFAELKVKAVLKPAQQRWLEVLGCCPGVEAYLWRPEDIERIKEILLEGK